MNISDLMLTTPLGAILIIVLLVLAAIAAWGAYANRPTARLETAPPTPPQRPTPAPEPPKEEPKPIVEQPLPKKESEPCTCKEEEPCAEERAEILRLSAELETAKADTGKKQGEIDDLTGRLANANRNLEEAKKAKPTKPQKVTVGNVAGLLSGLGEINRKAADDLRNGAKKDQPDFDRMKNRLEQFSTYLEQRGFERPDPGTLLQLLQKALKQ